MTFSRLYRYTAVCIAALFLLMQGIGVAHAATYGPAPHDHDGVSCAVSLAAESEAELPAPALNLPLPALIDTPQPLFTAAFISAKPARIRSREPPPRGPPSNQT